MEPILVKIAKDTLLTQNHFLSQKSLFECKISLWSNKMKFNEICIFEQKVFFRTLTKYYTPYTKSPPDAFGRNKWELWSKVDFELKMLIWSQKVIFDAKSGFLCKNVFLRPHVADAYKTNGILTKMEAFLAQSRFLSQKCVLDPKIDFWAQKSNNRPKRRLWAQKCAFSQKWPKS